MSNNVETIIEDMTYSEAMESLREQAREERQLQEERGKLLSELGLGARCHIAVDGEPPSGLPRLRAEIAALSKPVVILWCREGVHYVQGYDEIPPFRRRPGPNGPIDGRRILRRVEFAVQAAAEEAEL